MPTSDILQSAEYINLATFRRNGDAVATPIWAAPLKDSLVAFSAGKAGKVKRLRQTPRAQVVPCTSRGALLGAWQEAHATLLTDPIEIQAAHQALKAKYGWKLTLLDFASKLSGRYHQRVFLRIEIST